jgi:hypothetical protein
LEEEEEEEEMEVVQDQLDCQLLIHSDRHTSQVWEQELEREWYQV